MGKAFNQVAMTWRMNRDFFVFCGIRQHIQKVFAGCISEKGRAVSSVRRRLRHPVVGAKHS